VKGAGTSLYGTADGFNFLYQSLPGDGMIVARVVSVSPGSTGGVVIRDSLDPGAMSTFVQYYSGQMYFSYRTTTGGSTGQVSNPGNVSLPYWVKVSRSGSTMSAWASPDGVNWVQFGGQTISLGQNAYVGLGVSSGSTASLATGTFDNVSVSTAAMPAPVISSVSATTGSVGSAVVITGSGFGATQGGSAVVLNGAPVTITTWSAGSISVTLPAGASTGLLVVSVAPTMNNSNPVMFTVTAQPLSAPWLDQDVGLVGVSGSGTYGNGTFTVQGAGTSLYGTADGFHFVYQPLMGDGTVVARVVSVSAGSTGGVVIRDTLNASAMSTFVQYYNGQVYFSYRTTTGGSTGQVSNPGNVSLPYWVKVSRSGSTMSAWASADGVSWVQFGSQTISMGQNVYVGLGVSSGNTSSLATATFDNVSVSTAAMPAPVISSVSASAGTIGSQVVISGSGFGNSEAGSIVTLNGSLATVNSWSAGSVSVTIPSGATSGPLAVCVAPSMNCSNPVTFTVTVAPPSFALSASPGSVSVTQGASGMSTITVTPQNGFNGSVNLSASGLPSGVMASFSPNPATSSSTLTLTASGTATTGTSMVTITGTSGSLTSTATISLTVSALPNFSLSPSSSSLTITQGTSLGTTITVTPLNGFNGSVSLSASGLPSGVAASFSPNPAASTSTLTLTASSTATTGSSTVTITGMSGSLTNTTTISLSVVAPPNFTLSASPSSLSVTQGANATSMITVNALNGFGGSVSLSASGLPSGVTASFSPNPAASTSTLTLTASDTAVVGTATVTVTGMAGTLTNTTPINLTVSTASTLPTVWSDGDVGVVGIAGSASYGNGTFTVKGAGTSLYGTADGFNFLYQSLPGDGMIVARVVSVSPGSTGGVVIRDSLDPGAMSTFVQYYSGQMYFSYRTTTGGSTGQVSNPGNVSLPYWVKVSRSGSTMSAWASPDGVNWVQFGGQTISLGQNAYVGLGVSSGSTASLATGTFDNVSVSTAAMPAPVISSVSATTGSVGSAVVITGSGFGATQGGSAVVLNGAPVTITTWSAGSISVTLPAGASTGLLVVSVAPTMNNSNPVMFTVTAQPLSAPWLDQDVGLVGVSGSGTYGNGTFTVQGAGTSLYGTADGFHFVYQPLMGDGTVVARVVSVSAGSTGGVVIRDTLNASAMSTFVQYYNGQVYFSYRTTTGGSTGQVSNPGNVSLPYWVKVSRSGSTMSAWASADGVSWVQFGSQTISMGQNVYVGLGVSSGNTSSLATATFDNVSVTTP